MTVEPLAIGAVGDVATSSLLWRYSGQLHLCVAVRASFLLVDGGVAQRDAATRVAALAAADDRVPYRQGCDVWMVGHCNAKPLSPTAPLTTRIELRGGRDQLLDKQHRLMQGSDLGGAGYGPRRTGSWLAELDTDGVVEIPRNFDWTKLHAAPPSQRVRYLEGGEHLSIDGVLADRAKMRSQIPRVGGVARIWGRGSRPTDAGYAIHLVADTLGIDGDTGCFTIVWRGSFPIDDVTVPRRLIIAAGVADEAPVDWEQAWVMANTAALADHFEESTVELVHAQSSPASTPFAPERPSQQEGAALRPATIDGAPWSERKPVPGQRARTATLDIAEGFDLDGMATGQRPVLPFLPASDPQEPGPWDGNTPAFDISSMETVETPPHTSDEAATPFETSGEWSAQNPEED